MTLQSYHFHDHFTWQQKLDLKFYIFNWKIKLASGSVILRTRACGHSPLPHFPHTSPRIFFFRFWKLFHCSTAPLHRSTASPFLQSALKPSARLLPAHTQTPLLAFCPHTQPQITLPAPHTPLLHVFPPTGPETPKPLPARNPNPNPFPSPSPSPAPSPSPTSANIFLFWKRLSCTAPPLHFPSPHNIETKPASHNHRPAQPHTSGGRDPATAAVHNPSRSTHNCAPPLEIPYRSTNTLPHPNPVPASLS